MWGRCSFFDMLCVCVFGGGGGGKPRLDAEEMPEYKRKHWAIENSLHYVLDETFGEDKSTIRLGKNTMSLLRKCAYNIARLFQMETLEGQEGIPDIIDYVCDNLEIGL